MPMKAYTVLAAVFGPRIFNRAFRVSRSIETGRVWVNTYNAIPAGAPFGGYKTSGIGRETHKVILDHYTQMKNILIKLDENPSGFYPKSNIKKSIVKKNSHSGKTGLRVFSIYTCITFGFLPLIKFSCLR